MMWKSLRELEGADVILFFEQEPMSLIESHRQEKAGQFIYIVRFIHKVTDY